MDFDRHECILEAVKGLKKAGSWTGKTHLQKTLALASLVLSSSLPFEFVLYKHGPYSFDVDQELDQMATYDAIQFVAKPAPYGPTLEPSGGSSFADELSDVSANVLETIRKSAQFAGNRNILELESLATASWIRVREGVYEDEQVMSRLVELKPHLAGPTASSGVSDSKKFVKQFGLLH